MSPETWKFHQGLVRAVIMAVRAWQDWLKAKASHDIQHEQQEPKQSLQ